MTKRIYVHIYTSFSPVTAPMVVMKRAGVGVKGVGVKG
jgi:hypothetical protein